MKSGRAALIWIALAGWASADPATPEHSPMIGQLELGVFCTPRDMGQALAPGTRSGMIHVPREFIDFTWPGRQKVPAEIGLAFGVQATLAPGNALPDAEIRLHLPGSPEPEIWGSSFSDLGPTLSFYSFDRVDELIPGLWRFEAWADGHRLYSIEFEIVPAGSLPEIAGACGAVS